MLRLMPLVLLISCARYNLAHQCNLKSCKIHKNSVKTAKTKKELRPRYQCKKDKKEGRCLWVKI